MTPPALQLTLVRGAEQAPGVRPSVPVAAARFVIGRDPACDWPIADRTLALSARHCEIVPSEGGWMLRDLSTNGTFVNGAATRLAAPHRLADGDRIGLGLFQIEVRVVAAAASAPAAAGRPDAAARPAAARRGGDPAAMFADDWEHAGRAPGAVDGDDNVRTGFTRIERPPPRAPAHGRSADRAATAAIVAPAASAASTAPATDTVNLSPEQAAAWRAASAPASDASPAWAHGLALGLARGLGVAPPALADLDPAVAGQRLGELLRQLDPAAGRADDAALHRRSRAWLQGPESVAVLLAAALGPRVGNGDRSVDSDHDGTTR